jgi:hypothetical protein
MKQHDQELNADLFCKIFYFLTHHQCWGIIHPHALNRERAGKMKNDWWGMKRVA